MHEALGSVFSALLKQNSHYFSLQHCSNPSVLEVEAGGSEAQSPPWPNRKLRSFWGHSGVHETLLITEQFLY